MSAWAAAVSDGLRRWPFGTWPDWNATQWSGKTKSTVVAVGIAGLRVYTGPWRTAGNGRLSSLQNNKTIDFINHYLKFEIKLLLSNLF